MQRTVGCILSCPSEGGLSLQNREKRFSAPDRLGMSPRAGAGAAEWGTAPCVSMVTPLLTLVDSDKLPFSLGCVPQYCPMSSRRAIWPDPRKWAQESGGDKEGHVPFRLQGRISKRH